MSNLDAAMSEPDGGDSDDFELVLDPKVQESIGRSLKAHYDDIVNAPVPDSITASRLSVDCLSNFGA